MVLAVQAGGVEVMATAAVKVTEAVGLEEADWVVTALEALVATAAVGWEGEVLARADLAVGG